MLDLMSIILFFLYTFGIGYSISFLIKKWEANFLEKTIIRIGFGLAALPAIVIILSLIHMKIEWWIFLIISLIGPAFYVVKNKRNLFDISKFKLKINKSDIFLFGAILIFFYVFFMYTQGDFSYPWLSDGDSWQHALSTKYIASEKTVFVPEGTEDVFRYIDTYPPGYDSVMALMYQTSQNMIWNLNFFNALIASLGYLFFYLFLKKFLKSSSKALFATFILAMVPSFVSRFIWSHSLAVTLLPMFLYALVMIEENESWAYIAGFLFGSVTLVQPTKPIKYFVMFLIFAFVRILSDKKLIKQYFKLLLVAFIIALLWWGPMFLKYKEDLFTNTMGRDDVYMSEGIRGSKPFIGALGTATRMYYFDDFFITKSQNMINNPIGWGILASVLFAIGLINIIINYKSLNPKKKDYRLITLLWFIFTFAALYGGTVFPIALFSFRFWTLVSIPMAIIATEGSWKLFELGRKKQIPMLIILFFLVGGLFLTSGYQKYKVNTSVWGPEQAHLNYGQQDAYMFMSKLPKETKFFYPCHWEKFGDYTVVAYDLYACPWCKDEINFRNKIFGNGSYDVTPEELKTWLVDHKYQYFMIEGNCIDAMSRNVLEKYNVTDKDERNRLGVEATNKFLNNVLQSGLFGVANQTKGSVIWKVQ